MTVLDTNVLSALMRRAPEKHVVAWLDIQPRTSIWTTSVTVLEVRFGLQILPSGKRRSALIGAFETVLTDIIEGRVAPFDTAAAQQAGDLMAVRHRKSRISRGWRLSTSWSRKSPTKRLSPVNCRMKELGLG